MMGRQDEPEHLFYAFRLESHVPSDHLLHGIDAVFDFGTIRKSRDTAKRGREHFSTKSARPRSAQEHTGNPVIEAMQT